MTTTCDAGAVSSGLGGGVGLGGLMNTGGGGMRPTGLQPTVSIGANSTTLETIVHCY